MKCTDPVKLRILVLKGGWSKEREISLVSGTAIEKGLKRSGFMVSSLDIKRGSFLGELLKKKFDVAFIALHGKFGEDGGIQSVLEGIGAFYTGSGILSSALAMNKVFTKKVFEAEDISTPRWQVLYKKEKNPNIKIPIPMVIKPSQQGSAIGVSIVESKKDINKGIKNAFRYDDTIIIEEYIKGKEVSVGILGERALAVVELRPKRKFYDYKAKYSSGLCAHIVPAPMPSDEYKRVQKLAFAAHKALDCRGYSRVDMIIRRKEIYVLEVNTIPGMTNISLLPECAKASGVAFEDLLKEMVRLAMERSV